MVSIRAVIYCLGLEEGKAEWRGGASNPAFCAELPVLGERGEGVTPRSKRLCPPARPLLLRGPASGDPTVTPLDPGARQGISQTWPKSN